METLLAIVCMSLIAVIVCLVLKDRQPDVHVHIWPESPTWVDEGEEWKRGVEEE